MPHGHCYLWTPGLVWSMGITDALIGLAYVSISLSLYFLVKKIRIPFHTLFIAFGLFIFACGATHFMEIYTLWVPRYWLAAAIKGVTAVASVATAISLYPLRSKIIAFVNSARAGRDAELLVWKEQATQAAKAQLEAAFQAMSEGVMAFDMEGNPVLINDSQVTINGFSNIDEMKKNLDYFSRIYEFRYPDYSLVPFSEWPISKVMAGEKVSKVELRGKRKDTGQEWYFSFSGTPVYDHNGKQVLSMIVTRDVTIEKRAEESLKRTSEVLTSIMTSTSDVIYVKDRASRMVYCNPQTLKLAGKAATELLGKTDVEFLGAGNGGEEILAVDQRIMSQGQGETAEEWVTWPDGTKRFYMSMKEPQRDDSGQVIGLVGISRDITDLKNIQTELEEAVHARDEFLSIASHELKTPITSIKLQMQLSQKSVDPQSNKAPSVEKLSKVFSLANRQILRLESLVEDLLDVAKIRSGKLTLHTEDVHLAELVREVAERYGEQISESSSQIKFDLDESIVGRWDRGRIEQVVLNLLSNAIKYAPGQVIEMTVSRDRDAAILSVKDFGEGIAKEKQKLIFERFERVASSKNISGLGLGLFIVKQIVESHKGMIDVTSEVGHGSQFRVQLPL